MSEAIPASAATKRKNILICCDGTGNMFGDRNSNVVKLYTTALINDEQIGYYHPGVGTMGDPAIRRWIPRQWSKIKGLAFGAGFKANVLDAYRYLMEVYNDGDRVYLFGFSRGAYTARALAGLLNGYGLLCRGNEGHLPYAWRLYVDQHKERSRRRIDPDVDSAQAFKETFSHKNFALHFVGLWDTVSSVGWIWTPLRLFYVAENPTIRKGRHAVSLDERRCLFTDNLWGPALPGQDLVQVWFPGVHSDVGGSYTQSESEPANVALGWLLSEAITAGMQVSDDRINLVFGQPTHEKYASAGLYTEPVAWHKLHKSLKWLWWIAEVLPHRYFDKDDGKQHWRIPLGRWRKVPPGSIVHPTAVQRMDGMATSEPAYKPRNLVREELVELEANPLPTTAKLEGFYVYQVLLKNNSVARRALNWLGRWIVIAVFVVVELVVVFCVLLLLVKAARHMWHWHLSWHVARALGIGYGKLSRWACCCLPHCVWAALFR